MNARTGTHTARAGRVAAVVQSVCGAAVRESGAAGIVVEEDWTPEGELLYEWLVQALGEAQVWRAAVVHAPAGATGRAWAERPDAPLAAHPASKTALLLAPRLPHADLLPLGDLWASRVESLTGRWSGPPAVEELAREAGGIAALDAALIRLVEQRHDAVAACADLPASAAERLLSMYERGRWARLRHRLVPKLTARTLGIDLFD